MYLQGLSVFDFYLTLPLKTSILASEVGNRVGKILPVIFYENKT